MSLSLNMYVSKAGELNLNLFPIGQHGDLGYEDVISLDIFFDENNKCHLCLGASQEKNTYKLSAHFPDYAKTVAAFVFANSFIKDFESLVFYELKYYESKRQKILWLVQLKNVLSNYTESEFKKPPEDCPFLTEKSNQLSMP